MYSTYTMLSLVCKLHHILVTSFTKTKVINSNLKKESKYDTTMDYTYFKNVGQANRHRAYNLHIYLEPITYTYYNIHI